MEQLHGVLRERSRAGAEHVVILRLTPGFGQIPKVHDDAARLRTIGCPTGQVIERPLSGNGCYYLEMTVTK